MKLPEGFLANTEHTGRIVITSQRTGKLYAVEPIGTTKTDWGDVDPASKKTAGSYGNKYQGSIHKSESLIKEEHGFIKIKMLEPGTSPIKEIERIDASYPDRVCEN